MEYRQRDDWHDLCTENSVLAADALCELASDGIWPSDRWNTAFQLWSDQRFVEDSWERLSLCLLEVPKEILSRLDRNAARWLRAVASVADVSDESFLKLCERILRMDYASNEGAGDPLTQAINHPIGDVTEALLQWWFRTGLEDDQGLSAKIEPIFSELCSTNVPKYRHARVWLAAHAIALFRVDADWTSKNLIPFFYWANFPREIVGIWSGFLQSARFFQPFLDQIRKPFLETADHYHELGDRGSHYAGLLLFAALDETDTFSAQELAIATHKLPDEGLQNTARLLAQLLGGKSEDRAEYWKKRVKPYLQSIWPQSNDEHEELVYARLAEVLVSAGDQFPDAVVTFKHWLKPLSEYTYVVTLLQEAGHCKATPEYALKFLNGVVNTSYAWVPTDLGNCLKEISEAKEALQDDWRFLSLKEHSRRN